MASTRAAIRYAKAILEIAESKGVAVAVSEDMNSIASTINGNLELSTFIQNPTLKVEVKENALLEVFANTNSVTKMLFHLLFENKRFEERESMQRLSEILNYGLFLGAKNSKIRQSNTVIKWLYYRLIGQIEAVEPLP